MLDEVASRQLLHPRHDFAQRLEIRPQIGALPARALGVRFDPCSPVLFATEEIVAPSSSATPKIGRRGLDLGDRPRPERETQRLRAGRARIVDCEVAPRQGAVDQQQEIDRSR
ncbi:MAG: hypothetical protein O6913_04675, partial [Chloroflexi bacterium]|nr:hypothetical protein [Chloroflexota bacterium]